MKITLLVVGKTTTGFIKTGTEEYAGRIGRFIPYEIKVVPDVKTSRKMTPDAQKDAEGDLILAQLQASDHVVLLDERGKELTSRQFAGFIEQKTIAGVKNLVFIVGGPYGFSTKVYERAASMLSLSKMTFPHELIRMFFTEQVYRAMAILNHLPYHHD